MLRHERPKQAQALAQFRKQLFKPGGLFGRCQRISPWAFGAWGQAPPGATATATTASTVLLLPSKRSSVQPHGYTWAPEVVLDFQHPPKALLAAQLRGKASGPRDS